MTAPEAQGRQGNEQEGNAPPTLAEIKSGRRKLSEADRKRLAAFIEALIPILKRTGERVLLDPMIGVLDPEASMPQIIAALDKKAAQVVSEVRRRAVSSKNAEKRATWPSL